jgi:hypothetical protein
MGYRFNVIHPDDPYYENWLDRRRRSKFFWIAFFAWAPVTLALAGACDWLFQLGPRSILVGVLTGLVLLFINLWRISWPCPRCGKPFYKTTFSYWPVADNCLHCGLPEYSPHDDFANSRNS